MANQQELHAAVLEGCRRAIAEVRAAAAGEIAGFALCTDDDACTLFFAACTDRFVAEYAYHDVLFEPTEWRTPCKYELPPTTSQLVRTLYEQASASDVHAEHVDATFSTLTRVLQDLRHEALLPADVFLSVLSTDPGPHAEELETASIRQLNEANTLARWEKWRASFDD